MKTVTGSVKGRRTLPEIGGQRQAYTNSLHLVSQTNKLGKTLNDFDHHRLLLLLKQCSCCVVMKTHYLFINSICFNFFIFIYLPYVEDPQTSNISAPGSAIKKGTLADRNKHWFNCN